jgi:exodeoxyribonuclease VII small subunit
LKEVTALPDRFPVLSWSGMPEVSPLEIICRFFLEPAHWKPMLPKDRSEKVNRDNMFLHSTIKTGKHKMPKQTFEKSIQQLEEIVQELESGDLPLEKAIQRFEEGITLSKRCSKMLDETEKKISVLIRETDGTLSEKPFPTDIS